MKFYVALACWLLSSALFATAHTWHEVSLEAGQTGTWKGQLADVAESGFYFVDESQQRVTNFTISEGKPFKFGMVLSSTNNFNMKYTLVLTQDDKKFAGSPQVAFVIGAKGPAHPDIRTELYNGATGSWASTGKGENYTVGLASPFAIASRQASFLADEIQVEKVSLLCSGKHYFLNMEGVEDLHPIGREVYQALKLAKKLATEGRYIVVDFDKLENYEKTGASFSLKRIFTVCKGERPQPALVAQKGGL